MARSLTIGIVGCGIGGLSAAALLRDQGHKVTIYDQFPAPRPVGSALIVQPTGQSVLNDLGVLNRALTHGVRITSLDGKCADEGTQVLSASYGGGDPDRFGLAIHRGALFEILLDAAISRGVEVQHDSMVLGVDRPEDPYLVIENAREAGPFDLVIDASGASSSVTPLLTAQLSYGALWGVIDLPEGAELKPVLRQRYRGAHQMAGIMPIGSLPGQSTQKAAVFWSMRRDEHADWLERNLEDWKAETYELWPEFEYFVSGMTAHDQLHFATYAHGSLNKFHSGRVAYLGDAAHQASPQLGQGANHALLDAATLAGALAEEPAVTRALARYTRRRLLHVKSYQAMSALFTPLYQSKSGTLAKLRDRVLAPVSMTGVGQKLISRLICGDLVRPHGLGKPARNAPAMEAIGEPGE